MSSNQYEITCPCCGNEDATAYSENRPFDFQIAFCLKCGFNAQTVVSRMPFEDCIEQINQDREGEDEKKLSKAEIAKLKNTYDSADFSAVEDFMK